ncbi:helix-turn-helix transcriptional regulator [Psychrobacter cibarius]|nr:helix-turn-helix transcriptional regulator [Psychrobacter cibarius]
MAKRSGYTRRDIKNINVTVGLNLAAARRNAGMSQTEVMQAVWGVSNNRNRISEIENGKKDLTLIDLLIFQDLYGQSLDYICGLSTEPEIDMLAGTVNHVVNQSHALIEMLTGNVADVIVSHVKSICKNDHAALLDASKRLCSIVREDHKADSASVETVVAASTVMRVVRSIEVKQARQAQAIDTQMMQITERVDREDRHRLLKDRDRHYQYSIPLPAPMIIDDIKMVGVGRE